MPKQGFPCIGLEIGLGHILGDISFLDIDMMASLSIGIWNWIWVYLRSCICSKMSKLGFPCIGLEIGLGHILCVISFLDIDIMAGLSIGIWKWIGVYMRSCICSKILKLGFPCIGLEIGFGHILCIISFLDIDMIWYDMIWYHVIRYASLSIGIWNWIGVYLRSCLSSKMSKLFFLWIVMVNPGHISFADIFGSLSLHWYIFRFDKTDAILYIIVHQRGLS